MRAGMDLGDAVERGVLCGLFLGGLLAVLFPGREEGVRVARELFVKNLVTAPPPPMQRRRSCQGHGGQKIGHRSVLNLPESDTRLRALYRDISPRDRASRASGACACPPSGYQSGCHIPKHPGAIARGTAPVLAAAPA